MTRIEITPSIRAFRILEKTPNYRRVAPREVWLTDLGGGQLGLPIGHYRNPDKPTEVIGIFEDGVAWPEGEGQIRLRFSDLRAVTLPAGKESQSIALQTASGKSYLVPISGRQGKFLDCMEMLRFIRRCMEDAKAGGTTHGL